MLTTLLLSLGSMHVHAAEIGAVTPPDLTMPHEHYELDNGLHVILHPDSSLPQVVINIWYGVGSKDEQDGRSGFAHLFEHLMFMGTRHVPGSGFDDMMEAHGGWNNAWTSEDATDFYDSGPSNLLETLLWMEADRLSDLGKAMTQAKLDLQREVVRNERRQGVEDTPYGIAWEKLPPAMYPADHPYGHTVIGSHADLEAATLAEVVAFFDTWYVPNNASLVVAGDFDPDEIKPVISRLFGQLKPGTIPPRRDAPAVDRPIESLVELTDQVQIPMTAMAWHTAAALQPGDAEMDLVAGILGDGRSSRLYRRMVHDEESALEVDAGQYSSMLGSQFLVTAKPTEGHTLDQLENVVMEEIVRLATEGPTADELERVRNQLEMSFLLQIESLHARASALNRYRYLTGNPDGLSADVQRYRDADADGVKAAAASLTTANRAVIRVRPKPATP